MNIIFHWSTVLFFLIIFPAGFSNSASWSLRYYSTAMLTLVALRVDSSWNVMAHGDAREGKWRVVWRMEWVASTLHTTSEHGVSSITTADAHTSAASSWLNWCLRRFKWTPPFLQKTKSGFCACAITFQLASTTLDTCNNLWLLFLLLTWLGSCSGGRYRKWYNHLCKGIVCTVYVMYWLLML